MKRILILCALLFAGSAFGQTTQPTLQIEVQHNGKARKIIVAAEVAGRIANGTQTDEDRAAVAEAIELELGHVPFHTENPCHKFFPRALEPFADRLPNNCEASIEPRGKK